MNTSRQASKPAIAPASATVDQPGTLAIKVPGVTRKPTGDEAEAAIRLLMRYVGENPERDGLKDSPGRIRRALLEMCSGLTADPSRHLDATFALESDGMVVVRGIRFTSLCEHHALPFMGVADVGYIPCGGRVVGLSKLARVVCEVAARPQIQERIAAEVATMLQAKVETAGVGVRLKATHACIACRGVEQAEAEAITTVLFGAMRESAATRAEFLAACG